MSRRVPEWDRMWLLGSTELGRRWHECGDYLWWLSAGDDDLVLTVVHRWSNRCVAVAVCECKWWGLVPWYHRKEYVMGIVRKAAEIQQQRSKSAELGDRVTAMRFPHLHEYMTALKFEDGSPRKTSTVSLFADAGCWKAALNDREEGLVLFVTADTLEGLLGVLEASLGVADPAWRVATPPPPEKGRKSGR